MTNLEKLDTLPALQKALEQEREAQQRAVRQRGEAQQATAEEAAKVLALMGEVVALTARAEQAEGQQRSDVAKMQAWRERAEQAGRELDGLRNDRDILIKQWRGAEARAEQAERDRDIARREHADALSERNEERAARQQAERERDEARNAHGMACLVETEQRTRAERAEADNAALLDGIRKAVNQATDLDSPDFCECGGKKGNRHDTTCPLRHVDPLASGDHPGAALLAEVEALREAWGLVRGMFEDLAENGNCADAVFTERENAARVLRAVDAMTVKP